MNNTFNFLASQLLWFAAVGGAARGMWWLGPMTFLLFAAVQLSPAFRMKGDFSLMLLALPIGLVVDSTLAASGLARYASPVPFTWMAPAWILALWMGFALTFNHSAAGLMRRPWLAAVFGAVMGPFSYWIAARVWNAVEFPAPLWRALLVLGVLWSVAMWLLSRATRHHASNGVHRLRQLETWK